MTIFLPSTLDLLIETFEKTCKGLIDQQELTSRTFDDPCIDLMAKLRTNPLTRSYLAELEKEATDRHEKQISSEKEILQAIWLNFWRCNPSLKFRRELVQVKQILTDMDRMSTRPLMDRIYVGLLEIYDRWNELKDAPEFDFSLLHKAESLFKGHSIQGEKRLDRCENMKRKAQSDPVFCWSYLSFFQEALSVGERSAYVIKISRSLNLSIEQDWADGLKESRKAILFYAKMGLNNLNLERNPNQFPISCLKIEHQLDRKLLQDFLRAFRDHMNAKLLKIKDQQICSSELNKAPHTVESFIVEHGSKYWSLHSKAFYGEVYEDYFKHCPIKIRRKQKHWEQLVRKRGIDPRKPSEKRKRSGKMQLIDLHKN